jgi:putative transposase
MPRYVRNFLPGGTYFFTVALADRSSYLLVREIQRLRASYAEVQARHPFQTLAICVLPDHLHALWKLPEDDADVATRWSRIKRGFSIGVDVATARTGSQQRRRERGIWQRRYWEHQIRDEDDLARHVDYIHFNPVKHGHARLVRDWPFSSFHRWVKRGDLPVEWGLVQGESGGQFGERGGGAQQAAHPSNSERRVL